MDGDLPIVVVIDSGTVEVPVHVMPVLESLVLMDYDVPRARCGEAIRWLRQNNMAAYATGARVPVKLTDVGKRVWASYKSEFQEELIDV
jgi:hypothetical protein